MKAEKLLCGECRFAVRSLLPICTFRSNESYDTSVLWECRRNPPSINSEGLREWPKISIDPYFEDGCFSGEPLHGSEGEK